ncbi:MAG: zf-HC2 domain-containing protein [Planctomycetota bacterium]|nr:zf-HC2 domain-containing protein [Planctomycetota bacterium]
MNLCREVAERLLAYRDGELEETEEPFIKEHLQYCPSCLDLLNGYDEVCDVLHRLQPVNMPSGVLERCRERLRREAAGEPPLHDHGDSCSAE